jgi:gelsolin
VKKLSVADDSLSARTQKKLFCVVEGKIKEVENALLRRDMLDTSKCYLLDCGSELFIWTGRNTSLDLRKAAIQIADVSWHSCAS